MNINQLILIVKNKIEKNISLESINIEDKTFLHKNHKNHQDGMFHLKLTIKSLELKKLSEELKLCVGLCQVRSDFKKL